MMDTEEQTPKMLRSTVHGRLTAAEAASSLTAAATKEFQTGISKGGEDALWIMWNHVLDVAAETSHDHQGKLIEVLGSIKRQKNPAEFQVWGGSVSWKDLPCLGLELRERWNTHQNNLANLNAFAAQLTAAGVLDLALYGIWAMRDVLEDPEPEQITRENGAGAIKSVAFWFIYATDIMSKLCKQGYSYNGDAAMEGNTLTGKNWNGYNQERWAFWVDRLEQLHDADISDECKQAVASALKEAHRFDRGEL